MNQKHTVIVGAGPGGLATALILAHRGFKVTVFERLKYPGGRTSEVRLGDYSFDLGPTFLMMKFILDEIFEEAGKRIEDYIEAYRLDPMYRLLFDDHSLTFFNDHSKTKDQIASAFPGSEAGFDRFYSIESRRFEKIFPALQSRYVHFYDLLNPAFLQSVPYLSLGRSLMENLGNYYEPEKLKVSFSFQSKYLGMSPWECPGGYSILPLIEHRFGIYHVTGGLNRISLGLAKAAKEEGAEIFTDTPVKKLITEGRIVKGIELQDGTRVEADDVVVNADFGWAMTNLVDEGLLKKYRRERLLKKKFSCSTLMLYLGLDKLYDMPFHNIIFARDYRRNIEDITSRKILSDEFSFYLRNSSIVDKTAAPEGHSSVYVLVPAPNNKSGIKWDDEAAAMRDKTLDAVCSRTPMTDIRDHIREELMIHPLDWESKYNIYLGATFNLGHNVPQVLYFRPHNRFEELDHCYLVGGGTHPGSGLPTIFESGRITSNLICSSYGIPFKKPPTLERIRSGEYKR